MTQPRFAPILANDEVRELSKLAAPAPWSRHRPGEISSAPAGRHVAGRGAAGPDQGYALLLAERLGEQVQLAEGEHLEDVLHGAAVIAMRRSSLFGRAPVKADIELALTVFGYLGAEVPDDLVEARAALFRGVSHDYWRERRVADIVPESTLRSTPQALAAEIASQPSAIAELSGLSALATPAGG